MKLDQFEKGELEKLTNDLNKLCDEQGIMWQKYKAKQRKWFYAGVFFLIFAVVCGIIAVVLNKPNALIGVTAQLLAGSVLIINNIDGFRNA